MTYCMREFDRVQSGISACENLYTLHMDYVSNAVYRNFSQLLHLTSYLFY